MQGIPLAGAFATTLGFKECHQYPVGALVLCYFVTYDVCYILGIIPENDYGNLQFPSRVALKTADGNFDSQNSTGYNNDSTKKGTFNAGRPTDVVEGEHVVSNEFGVLLGLFQSLAVLKASELAQVQCYLLDDMVRIVSHNFEHLHALGECKIFHDGKALMAEFGGTHDPREALGIPQVESVKNDALFGEAGAPGANGDDLTDFYEFEQDERTTAIERFKLFLGKLGDFIHMFVTRPDPEAIRALAGSLNGKPDLGMANFHMGLDGRFNLRTMTGGSIEKTNWIMVPQRVRTADDPEGDQVDDIEFDKKDPFEFDDSIKVRENPSLYFLQIRDCNAYLQDYLAYKYFLKYKKDFNLTGNPEDETKLSSVNNVDPVTPVNIKNYKLRKSGIYLMDNGGIMLKDAWGSALVLEGGDIYIQAAKDIISQPLRNYITKAGKFITMTSRKDIDLSSTEAGYRLKTKTAQHHYSSDEGIIIQSDSTSDSEPSPSDKAYKQFGGILLKSNKGIYQYGEKIFDRASQKALYKGNQLMLESVDKPLELKSIKDITLTSLASIDFTAKKDISLLAKSNCSIIANTSLNIAGKQTNIGNKGSIIGVTPHPGSMPVMLDGVLPIDPYMSFADTKIEQASTNNLQEQMTPFSSDDKFSKLKFRFLDSSEYGLETTDYIPMTIAQQDDAAFGFLSLTNWTEKEINSTLPYPGKDSFDNHYISCDLTNLQMLNDDAWSKPSEDLKNTGSKLTPGSLSKYKVVK